MGFTGYTGPVKSPAMMLLKSRPPIDAGSRLAPMTATELGAIRGMSEAAVDRFSRSAMIAAVSVVSSIGNSTVYTPPSSSRCTW